MRVARTGEEGLEAVRRGTDLVLLDLNLPGMDGLEVCRMIRRQETTAHVPIIIVSARAEEVDRVLGLEMGADDYVVKPFSLKELAARAKVALRRASSGEAPRGYRDENWEIEFDAYIVRYHGEEIRLTHKEFELFRYMAERPGRVLTRERLMERVWGFDSDVDERSIDAHIRRLRQKLGPGAAARRDPGRARLPLHQVSGTSVVTAREPKRVLVLCTGNSCRSQMAEGWINHLLGGRWRAQSAGTAPAARVHPLAVQAMAEVGRRHLGSRAAACRLPCWPSPGTSS